MDPIQIKSRQLQVMNDRKSDFDVKKLKIILFHSGKINTTTSALQDAINALIMLQLNAIKTNVLKYICIT